MSDERIAAIEARYRARHTSPDHAADFLKGALDDIPYLLALVRSQTTCEACGDSPETHTGQLCNEEE